MNAGNRPMSLEEKRQRVMRELNVGWHEATRILAKRSAEVRKYKKIARLAKAGKPTPVMPYVGPRVVVEVMREKMTVQDVESIGRQARYLAAGRAARSSR